MLLLQVSDAVMYRAFPTTLRKAAHSWFKSLQSKSIHSFAQLSDLFQKHFVSSRTWRKNSASLLNVVQERNESLSRYLGCFNAATLEINNMDESVKYTAFMRELRPTSKFAFRILVDNGSSAEVLFYEAFQKMKIPPDCLRKIDTPQYGFSNHPVVCEEIIALPVTVGAPPTQAKLMLDFVVVRVPSAYNAILGRTSLNQLRAVVSTYHMKFPTENGVGEVKGDQVVARQCYMASCRNRANETLMIEDLRDETKVKKGKPSEDLIDIELYPGNQEKIVRVGPGLSDDLKLKLVDLLQSYSDIFTWTACRYARD
ncbi:hypothetical protein RJ639_040862 [Escallonia herrerae]|uniref:Retrotransposon gag domain-containing protein n=1 Tax=Escallonia herrerae TaxID=1293975 RepID=A0AA88WDX2_9ASTE|nr:hypothetical protein RJ639_040862 [Escallonia herrerae]